MQRARLVNAGVPSKAAAKKRCKATQPVTRRSVPPALLYAQAMWRERGPSPSTRASWSAFVQQTAA
eukprot:2622790-Alexandrium_andersonii.AAC.1